MINILYDFQAFTMQSHGGVSRCFVELIKHFSNNIKYQIAIKESDNIYLKNEFPEMELSPISYSYDDFLKNVNIKGKHLLYEIYNKYFLHNNSSYNINKLESIKLLKSKQYDIFHPTYFDDYFLPYLKGKPFILTIHDMTPELFPQYFSKYDYQIRKKKILANKAAHIIAVSETTKNDIVNLLHIDKAKISVIYHGYSALKSSNVISSRIIKEKYILFVGARNGYKNFKLFIKDISIFLRKHNEYKLVCTGKSFNSEEKKLLNTYKIEMQVIQIFADDNTMSNLYRNAECFIYPSLYEGFGLPILEAYAECCPVLLNYKSCFPEIAKDAAVFFNMDQNTSNLNQVLEEFIFGNSIDKNSLLNKQTNRLQQFKWDKSAQQLENIYKSIL